MHVPILAHRSAGVRIFEQVVGGGGGADIAPAMQAGAPGASLLSEPNNAWLGSGATHTDPATGTMMRSE